MFRRQHTAVSQFIKHLDHCVSPHLDGLAFSRPRFEDRTRIVLNTLFTSYCMVVMDANLGIVDVGDFTLSDTLASHSTWKAINLPIVTLRFSSNTAL